MEGSNQGFAKSYTFKDLEELHPVGAKLGKGSRAMVKLVKHQKDSRLMALKTISLKESSNYQEEFEILITECQLHKMCNHPNIIK